MDVEIVVIGAGVNGLASAWRLAERGHEVLVLERFRLGHDRGSSHGATRIFRTVYEHPRYVVMARAALPMWRELERVEGELVRITGGIDGGRAHDLARCAEALEAGGAAFAWLEEEQVRARYPWCRITGRTLHSPDTGVIAADAALGRLAERARAAGASILEDQHVLRIEPQDRGVTVKRPERSVRARHAVLAAGAWAPPLLVGLANVPMRVTDEQVQYVDGPHDTVPVIWRGDRFLYTVPSFARGPIKVAEHMAGPETDPDERTGEYSPDVASWVADAFPSFGPPSRAERCLYATTPDQDFVIERIGDIALALACSGHAFKFAPLTGEIIADLIEGARPRVDIGDFSAFRF